MKVRFHKKFLKDMADLPAAYRKKVEVLVFKTANEAKSILAIPGVDKMKGYHHYYKIRVGDYRVGFEFVGNGIVFQRVMHRKEIYRYFPIK